jgi:hypothetical protein
LSGKGLTTLQNAVFSSSSPQYSTTCIGKLDMNIDGWTGTWKPLEGQVFYANNPSADFKPRETRVKANGLDLWMQQDLVFPDGSVLTWEFDGRMDAVMRPLYFIQNQQLLTNIAFYLLDDNFGGDTNRRPDGSYIGSEYWWLKGDVLEAKGVHNLSDGSQFTYQEYWQRV